MGADERGTAVDVSPDIILRIRTLLSTVLRQSAKGYAFSSMLNTPLSLARR
jgi:hypothetical protein